VREQKRQALAVRIPAGVLGLYNRIMKSRMSHAVVGVRKRLVQRLFRHIPLQKVADIRIGLQVYTCDNCGRILYYEQHEEHNK